MLDIFANIDEACKKFGDYSIMDCSLQSADNRLLDVREGSLHDHVAIQPGAIAYFGSLRRQAARYVEQVERELSKFEKVMSAQARAELKAKGEKATIAEVESFYIEKNQDKISELEERLDQARNQLDLTEVWYDAWKTKGFSLKEYAALIVEESFQTPHLTKQSIGREDLSEDEVESIKNSQEKGDKLSRIHGIIRRNREGRGS